MATNRDLLSQAIADAKTVKDAALVNAKMALEEVFTPYLKEKLSAKITEMEEEEQEEIENEVNDDLDVANEEVTLDELLAELEESDETPLDEAKKKEEDEEEDFNIEDMTEEQLKSFIEDVIKGMETDGELEGAEAEAEVEIEEPEVEEVDEEINLDELLEEIEEVKDETTEIKEGDIDPATVIAGLGTLLAVSGGAAALQSYLDKKAKEDPSGKAAKVLAFLKSTKTNTPMKEEEDKEVYETIKNLKSEINEVNVLNAKLLYTNKIFRNKTLSESQKIKVLTAFDKAKTKKDAQLVYETLLENLKVTTTSSPLKESLGSASKALGKAPVKQIIEENAFKRMNELAFGKSK